MTPVSVLLWPKPYIGLLVFGLLMFLVGVDTSLALSIVLMTAFALCLHNSNFILRDAEYKALCTDCDITRKDIFGRACMLVFDSLLLLALITSAGVSLNWTTYLWAGAAVCLLMPLWVIFQSRTTYNPAVAQPGIHPEHWFPPILLALLLLTLIPQQTILTPGGLQPYTFLILLSSMASNLRRLTTFHGFAAWIRYVTLAGTMILVIWNYANIA